MAYYKPARAAPGEAGQDRIDEKDRETGRLWSISFASFLVGLLIGFREECRSSWQYLRLSLAGLGRRCVIV